MNWKKLREKKELTNEHLHQLRPCELQKHGVGLTRAGARQQRLSRSRRPVEEHAFGGANPNGSKLLGVGEGEDDGLHQLGDLLVQASDVGELLRRFLIQLVLLDASVELLVCLRFSLSQSRNLKDGCGA